MQRAPRVDGTAWAACSPSPFTQIDLSGEHVAHPVGADEVERAGLGGDDPVLADTAERERADAERVAEGDQRLLRDGDDGIRALEAAHRGGDGFRQRRGSSATSAAITSVSDADSSLTPFPRSSSRSSVALTRFPLCPSASCRAAPVRTTGCAFSQALEPVVE